MAIEMANSIARNPNMIFVNQRGADMLAPDPSALDDAKQFNPNFL